MSFLKGFLAGMRGFGRSISMVINVILLSVVYFLGVGMTSLVAKLTGKRFLDLREFRKESYWLDLETKKKSINDYYKQF